MTMVSDGARNEERSRVEIQSRSLAGDRGGEFRQTQAQHGSWYKTTKQELSLITKVLSKENLVKAMDEEIVGTLRFRTSGIRNHG